MDDEEYVSKLEAQCGKCECPELRQLFDLERNIDSQTNVCDFMASNVDIENATQEDKDFLTRYEEQATQLTNLVNRYELKRTELVDSGRLRLRIHSLTTFEPIGYAARERYSEVKSRRDEQDILVAIHCASCEAQIGLVGFL